MYDLVAVVIHCGSGPNRWALQGGVWNMMRFVLQRPLHLHCQVPRLLAHLWWWHCRQDRPGHDRGFLRSDGGRSEVVWDWIHTFLRVSWSPVIYIVNTPPAIKSIYSLLTSTCTLKVSYPGKIVNVLFDDLQNSFHLPNQKLFSSLDPGVLTTLTVRLELLGKVIWLKHRVEINLETIPESPKMPRAKVTWIIKILWWKV